MAERRMFAKTIIDSDAFLDMPMSAQALYFHLAMRAYDDGFVNNPRKIMRMVGASDDDARILLAKRFLISFESGVVVIKHWRIHNYIRNDRYKPTVYAEEMAQLEQKENGAYTLGIPTDNQLPTNGIPTVSNWDTQVRLGKDSVGKVSRERGKTTPPTVEEVADYCRERGNGIDPQHFVDYYTARGWELKPGQKVKDWKACVRTWEQRNPKPKEKTSAVTQEDIDRLNKYLGRFQKEVET